MEVVGRLYLDTNIFIRLGEGADDAVSRLLRDLIVSQEENGETFLCTSELTLAELLVHPYRNSDDRLIQLYDNWLTPGSTWLEVGPVARETLWYAAVLRNQYQAVKLPDAIHLSTAIGFECSHFLTGDQKLPAEVALRHSRWGVSCQAPPVKVIPPRETMLKEILEQRS